MIKKKFDFWGKFDIINVYSEIAVLMIIAVCFIAILVSQVILNNDKIRSKFSFVDQLEGVSVSNIVDTYGKGEITIKISNLDKNSEISVLENGEPIGTFNTDTIQIPVRNNSLIEIDGRKAQKDFSAKVIGSSGNVLFSNKNSEVTVNKNISFLTRIFLNNG